MRRLGLLALLAAAASCGKAHPAPPYQYNDLQILTGYGAKDLCSCLFVMKQSDDYCARYTVASPNLKTARVDKAARTVETQAILFWGARAHYVSDHEGCVAE